MSNEHFSGRGTDNRARQAVFELATSQDGVVARTQLLHAGYSSDEIQQLIDTSWLRAVHRGVYAVGHARADAQAVRHAALLAAGTPSALFRRLAAAHLGLVPSDPRLPELVVPLRRTIRRPGLIVHRSGTIDWRLDVTTVRGLPCTTAARTLVDLAGVLSRTQLERAAEQAEFRRLLDVRAVAAALQRAGSPKGAGALRAALGPDRLDAAVAGSNFEREVLAALLRDGAARPVLQQRFDPPSGEPIYVDLYWPAARLVVEVDGPHHELPLFRAKDAARDAQLVALGERVIRVPDRRWRLEPGRIINEVLAALSES